MDPEEDKVMKICLVDDVIIIELHDAMARCKMILFTADNEFIKGAAKRKKYLELEAAQHHHHGPPSSAKIVLCHTHVGRRGL